MSSSAGIRRLGVSLSIALACSTHYVHSFCGPAATEASRRSRASPSIRDESGAHDGSERDFSVAAVAMNGSDLTDRFKYKVHALMGSYDPPAGALDDENQTGNIVGAMLQFPVEYTFSAVGRTESEDSGEAYGDEVRSAVASVLGSDTGVELNLVPRGEKFTCVSATVTVESASMISSIYEELDALGATVMKF